MMKNAIPLFLLILFGGCFRDDDPAPVPQQTTVEQRVQGLTATEPEDTEPLSVEAIVESTSETAEPVPVDMP